jgi:pyruvate ferredoxin oxidoreductase alpha subunit
MTAEFWNGNMAAAQAARRARVQVIAAYPITPQTHTVEYLSEFVADGELDARLVKVESEHSALSACCGASVVGARAFTASCSQGLQLMSEVMYFTSGMRFPVVMAIANRTLSVPVNIWCDHQDTLVNRDAGWIQLYAGSVQEVYDLLLCAYRVAEDQDVSLPALVAYDGFILSHASEAMSPLTQNQADGFLPPLSRADRPLLDPEDPQQFGEVLFPDFYPDYEYKKHRALADSMQTLRTAFDDFERVSGRALAPIDCFACEDAEVVLLGLGSMMQTARWTVQELRANGGEKVGVARLLSFRPFPEEELRAAVKGARTVLVLDRDIGYGTAGMVFPDVLRALYHGEDRPRALNFIIGTGGKDVTPATIERCLELSREEHDGQTVFWPDARGPREGLPYTEGLEV